MGRINQLIWSGRAGLYLAVVSLLANLASYVLLTSNVPFTQWMGLGYPLLLVGMGSIALSSLLALVVLSGHPVFQRPREVLIRIAISTNIAVLTCCVYFYAGIIVLHLIKRMD